MINITRKLNPGMKDISLWRRKSGFKHNFSTRETWLLIRDSKPSISWARGIWFSQATPKYGFMSWLSVRNRMATMDRVSVWSQGIDTTCVLCKNALETRSHLFFECSFSAQL